MWTISITWKISTLRCKRLQKKEGTISFSEHHQKVAKEPRPVVFEAMLRSLSPESNATKVWFQNTGTPQHPTMQKYFQSSLTYLLSHSSVTSFSNLRRSQWVQKHVRPNYICLVHSALQCDSFRIFWGFFKYIVFSKVIWTFPHLNDWIKNALEYIDTVILAKVKKHKNWKRLYYKNKWKTPQTRRFVN